ncbi:hypothetical protein CGRA01v4_11647 [Colletotrichum graminicola]|nr:hypothetical protein CGRA01v4_11647 [Colletotrichum graminicola]
MPRDPRGGPLHVCSWLHEPQNAGTFETAALGSSVSHPIREREPRM